MSDEHQFVSMSDEHQFVSLVRRPLSETARIYAEQTSDAVLRIALSLLAKDIERLEVRIKELEIKLDNELWKEKS
jgi:hypothetical protein